MAKYRTLNAVRAALGLPAGVDRACVNFVLDSRQVGKGDLFFALKGAKVDGTAFLEQVAAAGACGAVVPKEFIGEVPGLDLLRVEDVVEAIQLLAQKMVERMNAKVIGITGTIGKTTTKEFVATLLGGKFKVGMSQGNQNSQVGLPRTILQMDGDEEVLVLEMATGGPGTIAKLTAIAPPDIGVLTKMGISGFAFFEDEKAHVFEKCQIFAHPKTKRGLANFQLFEREGVCIKALDELRIYGDERVPFDLPFEAPHLKENFLGAMWIARMMGLSDEEIAERSKLLKTFSKRFEIVEKEGVTYINDSYNAVPESILPALKSMLEVKGKKIGVLGSLAELGSKANAAHRDVAHMAAEHLDVAFLIGAPFKAEIEEMKKKGLEVHFFESFEELKSTVLRSVTPGDCVLIKGANSHALWRLLEC